jgi:transmembrane sensor
MMPKDKPQPQPGTRYGAAERETIKETAARWIARRDAGLNGTEEAELEAWLELDPRHRAAFAEYDSAWSVLDRPVRAGVADDVLEELRGLGRRQRRRRVLASGAAMAVLIAGISFWAIPGERAGGGDQAVATTTKILLPARHSLPDGSVVELKADAEITPDFDAQHRRVTLRRGEAHFQVAKDAMRPFLVEAQGVKLRAVGTAFSVQIGENAVDVLVTQGRVAVEKSDAGAAAGSGSPAFEPDPVAMLDAGQGAEIDIESAIARIRTVAREEAAERLSWRAPRLEFGGTPLSEVVALLNLHATSGLRISIGDSSLAPVRVSGLFRTDNTAALLDLLDSGFGITAERRSESVIVLRKAAGPR